MSYWQWRSHFSPVLGISSQSPPAGTAAGTAAGAIAGASSADAWGASPLPRLPDGPPPESTPRKSDYCEALSSPLLTTCVRLLGHSRQVEGGDALARWGGQSLTSSIYAIATPVPSSAVAG